MSAEAKPSPRELWLQAGGDTDAYDPARYKALLIEHGHLIKREGAPEGVRPAFHPFEIWRQVKGDPEEYLKLVNRDRVRVRLKRGVKMSADVARELYLHAELSYLEVADERGNWQLMIDHRRGGVSSGVFCGVQTARRIFPPCAFCHKPESGEFMCDWPTGNPCKTCEGKKVLEATYHWMPSLVQVFPCDDCNETGVRTCGKPVCPDCVSRNGKLDYCPNHSERAGAGPARGPRIERRAARVKLEPCEWTSAPGGIVNRKCLRESCAAIVTADDRVLYFERRKRAMCESCGREYLEVAR